MAKKEETAAEPVRRMIPSGVTLLDLACTDTTEGMCPTGHASNVIGDRNSGKSFLCMGSMAETFRRYGDAFRYFYFDYEHAVSFNVAKLFGRRFADAVVIIEPDDGIAWCTENLAVRMLMEMRKGPCFFVIDCMDHLKCKAEVLELGVAVTEDAKGSYGTEIAKANKRFFRAITAAVGRTQSHLLYVSQQQANIGYGAQFKPHTRSGGKSLGFNAYVEMWIAPCGAIKQGDTQIGAWTKVKIARSKANGKTRELEFPILPAYGIDDTRANIDWLEEEGVIVPFVPADADGNKGRKRQAEAVALEDLIAEDGGKKERKKKSGALDLRPIGIEYTGKEPYLFVEENGHVQKVVDAVRDRWAANEAEVIAKSLGGRRSRYE